MATKREYPALTKQEWLDEVTVAAAAGGGRVFLAQCELDTPMCYVELTDGAITGGVSASRGIG